MEKVKVKRKKPSLDMTPMVDLGFLLVTFFMLTTKFAPEEPVVVDMPSSVSEIKIPDMDVLTVSISKNGVIFFNMDGKYNRQKLLEKIGEKYGISFTEKEIHAFSVSSSIGLPIGNLKEYLNLDVESRKLVKQQGIPCDSVHNELADWLVFSRITNPNLRIAIKADRELGYPVVKNVLNTFQKNKISRFNLITNMEKGPNEGV